MFIDGYFKETILKVFILLFFISLFEFFIILICFKWINLEYFLFFLFLLLRFDCLFSFNFVIGFIFRD